MKEHLLGEIDWPGWWINEAALACMCCVPTWTKCIITCGRMLMCPEDDKRVAEHTFLCPHIRVEQGTCKNWVTRLSSSSLPVFGGVLLSLHCHWKHWSFDHGHTDTKKKSSVNYLDSYLIAVHTRKKCRLDSSDCANYHSHFEAHVLPT